jgi:hypothetical protein
MIKRGQDEQSPHRFTIVLNWTAELLRRVPVAT